MEQTDKKLSELLEIVARLRAPDGCPWDRKQTPQTFKSYVIEEAHELLEAIDGDDSAHICEELGDLLFQLVFLARLYEEQGLFGMDQVIATISAKMVRRHPHVFGGIEPGSDEDLRRRWQEIKAAEKGGRGKSPLASVPRSLPALRRAQRVAERAAKAGCSRLTLDASLRRLEQDAASIPKMVAHQEKAAAALGDLLLAAVEVCRLAGINAEEALQAATDQVVGQLAAEDAASSQRRATQAEKD
ncbi:MAG: nucleoside triphosphate pyrophosphohydrolase [Desulfobacteraceae bacterium]|nr:nucleoside triphosphate pyrophosphohydrolase [Desulfobacteraceae bacterium]